MTAPDLDALEKLVAGLVGFAAHDDDCTVNRYPGADACSCGLRPILQQARALLDRNGKADLHKMQNSGPRNAPRGLSDEC